MDPRLYQIGALSILLAYGVVRLEFDVAPARIALLVTTALATQFACTRLARLPRFDPRSALISGLSLCLLLRTESPSLAVMAAGITVASKFVFRWDGKHLFNPTNLGIVALLLVTDRVWVSPGQWGSGVTFAFAIACLGGLVVQRAARADVTLAFLVAFAAVQFGRAAWLGQPWGVPLHRMENGALLLFAFFMISDPKTTPDSRLGRIVFSTLVAAGAGFVSFVLYRTNGLLWSLAVCSLAVPLIDRLLPGTRYAWKGGRPPVVSKPSKEFVVQGSWSRIRGRLGRPMAVPRAFLAWFAFGALVSGTAISPAQAFCGFFVSRADAKLFNKASQVVLVRDGDRTVLTMVNDFKGDLKEFAVVVPVPTVLEREQIHAGDPAHVQHLDAYTAPRLVEYHDEDPCQQRIRYMMQANRSVDLPQAAAPPSKAASGVTVEARYTVGEYDIVILSARESDGLATWLVQNGYRIPPAASRALGVYLKQGMKFFVAKVNLEKQAQLGYATLRPLQIAYENPKFMLPIRLGMVNAEGTQDLLVYALTRQGRVETTNYRTVRLPSDVEIPPYVESEFAEFYRALFAEQVRKQDMRAVFLEYAWDMGWCDPCAADPLSPAELRALGVFWLDEKRQERNRGGATDVFVTRLHVRYDAAHFPEDLTFQVTGDRENFQGRYILRHPWSGEGDCTAARNYRRDLAERQEREVQTLASLTGWKPEDIRKRAGLDHATSDSDAWWRRVWD